jgi:hypothetical protein
MDFSSEQKDLLTKYFFKVDNIFLSTTDFAIYSGSSFKIFMLI